MSTRTTVGRQTSYDQYSSHGTVYRKNTIALVEWTLVGVDKSETKVVAEFFITNITVNNNQLEQVEENNEQLDENVAEYVSIHGLFSVQIFNERFWFKVTHWNQTKLCPKKFKLSYQ